MSKKQKNLAVLASVFLMLLTIAPVSNAMHIMEGFLPVKYFSNRKLFPYDRYRSWSNLIWTMCNKYLRYYRINFPGNLTCTRRINNIRS